MSLKAIKSSLPWWARIGTKLVLARLPVPYALWKRLHLFEHGGMDRPRTAFDTFLTCAKVAGVLDDSEHPRLAESGEGGFSVLEIGPGDSLFTAVIAHALGASRSWLVDAGRYAINEIEPYRALADLLGEHGYNSHINGTSQDVSQLLEMVNARYLTDGVASLKQLPDSSVDFCFSNAVLEHIPKEEFSSLVHELSRVLKTNGVSMHRVDLQDHLGGALNNLRFSDWLWESKFFSRSGFYTNRIGFGAMIRLFEDAGFRCETPRIVCWESLPTPKTSMARQFRCLLDSDLQVNGFDVVLTHRAG